MWPNGGSGPLVSVCIPTYNNGSVIGDAIRSAKAQDYANLEILVVDNHSEDDTERVVAEFAAADPRVRYLRHPENIGMARNFSACVSLARGEYVKILCADDAFEAGCVRALLHALEGHPDISLAGCARGLADANLRVRRVVRARTRRARIAGGEMIRECFAFGNRIGEPTAVMFRRNDARRGFDDRYSQLVDLEMWFHLLRRGDFAFIPQCLCRIRRHPGQVTQANLRDGRIVADKRELFRDFAPALRQSLSLFEKLSWDGRMALGVARTRAAGNSIAPSTVEEVFLPALFAPLIYPAARALVRVAAC